MHLLPHFHTKNTKTNPKVGCLQVVLCFDQASLPVELPCPSSHFPASVTTTYGYMLIWGSFLTLQWGETKTPMNETSGSLELWPRSGFFPSPHLGVQEG